MFLLKKTQKKKKLSKYFYSTAWVYFYFMCIIQTSETEGNRIFSMLKVRSKSNYSYSERDKNKNKSSTWKQVKFYGH